MSPDPETAAAMAAVVPARPFFYLLTTSTGPAIVNMGMVMLIDTLDNERSEITFENGTTLIVYCPLSGWAWLTAGGGLHD